MDRCTIFPCLDPETIVGVEVVFSLWLRLDRECKGLNQCVEGNRCEKPERSLVILWRSTDCRSYVVLMRLGLTTFNPTLFRLPCTRNTKCSSEIATWRKRSAQNTSFHTSIE